MMNELLVISSFMFQMRTLCLPLDTAVNDTAYSDGEFAAIEAFINQLSYPRAECRQINTVQFAGITYNIMYNYFQLCHGWQ